MDTVQYTIFYSIAGSPGLHTSIWTWHRNDPAAVHVSFRTPNGSGGVDETNWVFGRELLADGITSRDPAGNGDVKIQLSMIGLVLIDLSSPEGQAILTLDLETLQNFMTETDQACPAASGESFGEESQIISDHLDRILPQIFEGA